MTTNSIDVAIKCVRDQTIRDATYNGSIRTETKAHRAVRERLEDARPHIPKEFLTLFDALTNGVLADISDAGEQIRSQL